MWLKPFTIYQPSYPAGINWGHPLAQGLVSYVIGYHQVPVDLVSGRSGIATSPTTARARTFYDGMALDVSASVGARFDFGADQSRLNILVGPVSGLFSGQFNATSAQAIFGAIDGTGVALAGVPVMLYTGSAGTHPGFIRSDGGSFSWWRTTTTFPTGRPMRYAFTQSATATSTPVFWQDGVLATAATDGASLTTATSTATTMIRLGNRPTGDRQFNGLFGMGALWARQHSPRDLSAIGEAPYQVLRASAWKSRPSLAGGGTSYAVSAAVWAGIFGAGAAHTIRTATSSPSVGQVARGAAAAQWGATATLLIGETGRAGTSAVWTGKGTIATGPAIGGKAAAIRRSGGLVGIAMAARTGTGLTRSGGGRIAAGVSVHGSGSRVSGAAASGLVVLGVALQGGATARRGAAGAVAAAVAGRAGATAARQASGRVVSGQAARSGFQVRRAMAGIVAQAAGHAGQVAARRVLRGLVAEGIILLVQARITAPGNGLRRLVALIDGRSIRAGRYAAPEHTEQDQRRLAAPRAVRRLAALKDD